jgi:hypothetical protein
LQDPIKGKSPEYHIFKVTQVGRLQHTDLGLNDGESGKRSTALGVGHLGGSLQQPGVEVEDITRVGVTARRTTQEHLLLGLSLLGQIVEDDDDVHAVVLSTRPWRSQRRVRGTAEVHRRRRWQTQGWSTSWCP